MTEYTITLTDERDGILTYLSLQNKLDNKDVLQAMVDQKLDDYAPAKRDYELAAVKAKVNKAQSDPALAEALATFTAAVDAKIAADEEAKKLSEETEKKRLEEGLMGMKP